MEESLMAQHKKNLPAIQETQKTWIQFLGQGRSPGVRGDNTLQYSCLDAPMGGGAWRTPVHGIAKSRT